MLGSKIISTITKSQITKANKTRIRPTALSPCGWSRLDLAAVNSNYSIISEALELSDGKLILFSCLKKAFRQWTRTANLDMSAFQIDQAAYGMNVQLRSLANLYRVNRGAPKMFPKIECLLNKFKIAKHKDTPKKTIDAFSLLSSSDEEACPLVQKAVAPTTCAIDWDNFEKSVLGDRRQP